MIAQPVRASKSETIDWYSFLRRPRLPSPESLDSFRNRSILITGAGGSIGTALSLQLAAHLSQHPAATLILLDASEQALYALQSRLSSLGAQESVHTVLGSTTDASLLDELFSSHQPQIVFHAAAHKHLPLLEEQPLAAITNNILGTQALCDCARRHTNPRIVLLSTDKASDPTSILGATKNVAEQITLANDGIVLRLCNVLETEGSVVELFLHQINRALPITLTDPNAERFFLTLEESADLLLVCSTYATPRRIFVPNIERACSILSLAEFLTNTISPGHPTSILYTGLRPGEKTHETLWSSNESPASDNECPLPGLLRIIRDVPDAAILNHQLNLLTNVVAKRDLPQAIAILQQLVPNYKPGNVINRLIQQAETGALSR